jgi:hypothetical protein
MTRTIVTPELLAMMMLWLAIWLLVTSASTYIIDCHTRYICETDNSTAIGMKCMPTVSECYGLGTLPHLVRLVMVFHLMIGLTMVFVNNFRPTFHSIRAISMFFLIGCIETIVPNGSWAVWIPHAIYCGNVGDNMSHFDSCTLFSVILPTAFDLALVADKHSFELRVSNLIIWSLVWWIVAYNNVYFRQYK